jgi:hypothetical protein
MRILYAILLTTALNLLFTSPLQAETIEIRARGTVKKFEDDQNVTAGFTKVGDPVIVALTYEKSESNNSAIAESTHDDDFHEYGFNARRASFSISIGGRTWQHDFGVGDLKVRVSSDVQPPSQPHDRLEVTGRGVIDDTFPWAQSGLNYFNLRLVDKDGSMLDSLDLPSAQTIIDITSLGMAGGVVETRDADSKIIWSLDYAVDDVNIQILADSDPTLLTSLATLIIIGFVFCVVFLLVVACIAHLIPKTEKEGAASNDQPNDRE